MNEAASGTSPGGAKLANPRGPTRVTGTDVVIYDPAKLARDETRVERGFWRKLRKHAGRVPFLDELLAAYYGAIDPKTPLQAKAVLMGALAYFVMPVDMMPDFIVWFGFTDDAAVLYAAIKSVAPHIKDEHRVRARNWLGKEQRPQTPTSQAASNPDPS
ncbi:MAG: YkvA family protein [Dongiaceae bacterium]